MAALPLVFVILRAGGLLRIRWERVYLAAVADGREGEGGRKNWNGSANINLFL